MNFIDYYFLISLRLILICLTEMKKVFAFPCSLLCFLNGFFPVPLILFLKDIMQTGELGEIVYSPRPEHGWGDSDSSPKSDASQDILYSPRPEHGWVIATVAQNRMPQEILYSPA